MYIQRANVYRLDPTPEQAANFAQWAGACRFVYNLALEQRRDYSRRGRNITHIMQQNELPALRAEVDWIRAVPSHALQAEIKALENAYRQFLSGVAAYPKPRKKGDRDSFSETDPARLGIKKLNRNRGVIKFPKVGWVRVLGYHPIGGEIRRVTISRKAGHWYASVAWRAEVAEPKKSTLPPVGIDLGVVSFATLSDGTKIEPLNAFKKIQPKIAKEQRKWKRKKKFSANWKRCRAKVAKLQRKAANARKDYLHKLSTTIAKSHGVVKIEALKIQNMTASARGTVKAPGKNVGQKRGLNLAILDQGWGMFAIMLSYKLEQRGGELIEVSAINTSQTCSCCGAVDQFSRKSQSIFKCTACGHAENADVNAAKNILAARILAPKPPKRTLNKRVGKRKQSSQLALADEVETNLVSSSCESISPAAA